MNVRRFQYSKPIAVRCYRCKKEKSSYLMMIGADYESGKHVTYVVLCKECYKLENEEDSRGAQGEKV